MISTTGNSSGFSLLELIVVIGIILSVTVMSSLYFKNHFSGTLLKASAQEITSTLIWARRLAITKRKPHRVTFHPQKKKYWIEDIENMKVEGVNYLKEGINFANPELGKWGEKNGLVEAGIQDNAFFFYPQGTAEGGSIYLQDGGNKKWYTITITPSTGVVNIYPEKH